MNCQNRRKRVKIIPPALTIPACIIAETGVGAATDSITSFETEIELQEQSLL